MNKKELTTLAIVAGVVVAAIYFINKTAAGTSQGLQDAGAGAGAGLTAAGQGVGDAASTVGDAVGIGILGYAAYLLLL